MSQYNKKLYNTVALQLDAVTQNISTPTGDSGTYTWADVVAVGSTLLDTYGTSQKPFYRWRGIIEIKSATLNIKNTNLELYGVDTSTPGIIRATNGGVVNFGEKSTVAGKDIYKNGCNITVTRFFFDNSNDYSLYAAISYTSSYRFDTSATVNIYQCRLFVNSLSLGNYSRLHLFFSSVFDSNLVAEFIPTGKLCTIYLQANKTVSNVTIQNLDLELTGATALSNLQVKESAYSLIGYISYILDKQIKSVEISNFLTLNTLNDYYVDQGTRFDFVNCPTILLNNGRIEATETQYPKTESRKLYTHNLKLTNSAGTSGISGALVTYIGRTTQTYTSDSLGLLSQFKLVVEETAFTSLAHPGNYTPYSKPIPTVDYSFYTRQIKSYLHIFVEENIIVINQLGSSDLPFQIALQADSGVTQSNTSTVGAYTGIAHTTTTITITQARTLDEIYDSRKLYWRNNSGVSAPYKEGNVFNLGGANLVINGVTLVASSKFNSIQTTGTATFANNGSVSELIVKDSTGSLVPITITGAVTGASIRVFRSPIDTYPAPLLSGIADGTGKLSGNFLYTGSDIPVIIIARLFGYIPYNDNNQVNGTITSNGLSASVLMQTDSYI